MEIRVKVLTEVRKESIKEERTNMYRIGVRAPKIENQANLRVREMLADHFEVRLAQVRIMSGHHSRNKVIRIS